MKNGALELDTIEAAPHIENGQVVDLVIRKKNRARYLIENFMIGANRTMVAFFEKHHYPYIQRILRTPDRWLRIVEIAQHYQEHLPYEPDAKALEKFLAKRREADPVHFPDLSLAVVKILGQAEYVMAEPGKKGFGHFGLAGHDYTHSTAPNRRYVDVVIQRLLKAILANETPPYSKSELEDISVWCTDRSIAAKKVERFMVKVVGCVLLSSKIGENFEAIVTGASEKGTYARLVDVPVEGRVMRGEGGLDIGQNIRVRLISLNPKKGFIDFERVKSQKHDQKDKI
ncbi:MAG: hypothetical protein A2Z88_09695 [Omnitrophica WOR_2 bacterium GWA2_47_8]|nr:MAG: hypothetical protein A2Z88_09695 [Omnitrophica WOR_2 bacterium GWA2_47_8]